ncbi:MAG: cadherin domain-containing protein [Cyclobacteriaceae bacterium]
MKILAIILLLLCTILQDTFSQGDERLTRLTEYELDGTFKADNVCMQGDYLYAISDFSVEEIKIFDISDPSNPIEVGNHLFDFDLDPGSLIIEGDILYIGSNVSGTKDVSFVVMDVSNRANPVVLKSYFDIPRVDDSSKTARQVTGLFTKRGNIIYAKSGTFNLAYIDVSDPLNAKVIGGYGDSFGTSLFSGIDHVKILDENNAWLDRNDFRHASVTSNGALSVGSNQGVTGELYDFEFNSTGNLGYAATWQGSAANVLTFSNNNNIISELDIIDVDDSIGGFGFSAEVEIFEKANLLFVQGVTDFLVLDISDSNNPDPVKVYEGDSYLRIHRDFLVVQGFNGSMIFYQIDFDNEEPSIEDQTFSINESESNGTSVGFVQSSDTDNDPLKYSILSGNDEGTFQIDEGTGEITVADENKLDFESNEVYSLVIQVSDGFESASAQVTINVLEVNLPPEINNQVFSINENSFNGTQVGQIQANDEDSDDLTFSIATGNESGTFNLDSDGSLTIADRGTLDFFITPIYTLIIEVTDGESVVEAEITVNIEENFQPQITDQTFSVSENTLNGTIIGIVEASDAEDDILTFVIATGNEQGTFDIDSETGELIVANAVNLDFANSPTYQIGIEVSDGAATPEATITITIIENQAPQISDQSFTISENTPDGNQVGSIQASDANDDDLIFYLASGNELSIFNLDNQSGIITVADSSMLDFFLKPEYMLMVDVFDGQKTSAATITIDLTENLRPMVSDSEFSVDEDLESGSTIGSISASDPNNDLLIYTILSGDENDALEVDSAGELKLRANSNLDFESISLFELEVLVSDGKLTVISAITVNVNNIDEVPEVSDQSFSIDENSLNGVEIGIIEGSDPEGASLIFSVDSGNSDGFFSLNESTGQIEIDAEGLNFEEKPSHTLVITISDGQLSRSISITINVNDVNESPEIADQQFILNENPDKNKIIGVVTASDPEGDNLSYTITSGNNDGTFLISSAGEISVNDSTLIDFEFQESINLTIEVSDGNLSDNAIITVDLNDINETPTMEDQNFTLSEESENGHVIGSLVSTDPEGDVLTYSITKGNENEIFSLNETTGELVVVNIELIDFESTTAITLNVDVSDDGLSSSAEVTIELQPKVVAAISLKSNIIKRIYPNPANHYVNLELNNTQLQDLNLTVYSLQGSKVFSQWYNGDIIDVSKLIPGFYILELSENSMVKGKFKIKIHR